MFKKHGAVHRLDDDTFDSSQCSIDKQYTLWIECGALANPMTGIPRVIFNIVKELLIVQNKINVNIELVEISDNQSFQIKSLNRLKNTILGIQDDDYPKNGDCIPKFRSGDVLLLPAVYNLTSEKINYFRKMIHSGLCIIAVIHDLIPITHPEYFHVVNKEHFTSWIKSIDKITNGVIAVSKETVKTMILLKKYTNPISCVHLGYMKLDNWKKIHLPRGKNILMVSTIEPRKKYAETLLQFERVWETRDDINLIIAGKIGWDVDDLKYKLETHPRRMKNLFFMNNIPDDELNYIYKHCDAFLFSSDVEGFGLGIVEAARFGTPLLLRDIPVFREIAADNATYFTTFEELYTVIIENIDSGFKRCDGMNISSWADTAYRYLNAVNDMRNIYAQTYNKKITARTVDI